MRYRIYQYTVTGMGEFPFDMLRYDHAWPAREDEMHLLSKHSSHRGKYTIHLNGTNSPTDGRWHSFLWAVGEVTSFVAGQA